METDIKKISLEIEEKSGDTTTGIDSLIDSLELLDVAVKDVYPDLNRLSASFDKISNASKNLQTVDFSPLQKNLRNLNETLKTLDKNAGHFESFAGRMEAVSKGLNGLRRSMKSVTRVSSEMKVVDVSHFSKELAKLQELQNTTQSFKAIHEGAKKLSAAVGMMNRAADKLPEIMKKINSMDLKTFKGNVKELAEILGEFNNSIADTKGSLQGLSTLVNKLPTNVNKATRSVKKINEMNKGGFFGKLGLFGGADMLANVYMIHRTARAISKLTALSDNFIETQNLFNVVMGESTRQAEKFVSSLNIIGVDTEQAMRFQAAFYDLGNSLGMTSKNAYTLSEQFTKLSYDYASLYNLPVEQAFQKLQAAAVGTVEPIRRLGKDITMAKLEEIALSLGIDKSVRAMTQAERTTLRFIAVMQQSQNAMNDMERTIDQPANALRVLRAQSKLLAREIGNLLIPAMSSTLPYLIAIVKFIKEAVHGIAALFGVKLFEFDYNAVNHSIGVGSGLTGNIADNLDKGQKSAKKLKDYLLGIDELNVLSEDKNVGSLGGLGDLGISGGDLGLDLEAFGYQDVLKDVKDKSEEILKTMNKWKPLIFGLIGLFGVLWSTSKVFKFIAALKGITAGTATLALGAGKAGAVILPLTATLTSSAVLAGLGTFAAIFGGIAVAGLGIYYAIQPAVKEVDLFGEGISSVTENKLKPFIETWKELDFNLTKLDWTGAIISDEDIEVAKGKVSELVQAISQEIENDKEQYLSDLSLFDGYEGMDDAKRNQLIKNNDKHYDEIEKRTKNAQKEINDILATANGNESALTQEQSDRLRELREQIKTDAITIMSETEEEQELLLMRATAEQEHMTAESASKILKGAIENKEKTIENAKNQRDRLLLNLEQQKKDGTITTKAQYDAIRKNILEAYDKQVADAESGYTAITEKVRIGMGDMAGIIDYEQGTIKSNGEIWLDDIKHGVTTWIKDRKRDCNETITRIKNDFDSWCKRFTQGWDNFFGGLRTYFPDILRGFRSFFNGIGETFLAWANPFRNEWDNYWKGINAPGPQSGGSGSSSGQGSITYSLLPNDNGISTMSIPATYAFDTGGMVPMGARFVSPDAWTAGETGRKELIGTYRGKTTVMPLENTSFVSAIHDAVYDAMTAAQVDQESTIVVQPTLTLEGRDIKQAEEEYTFKRGGSGLIRKI